MKQQSESNNPFFRALRPWLIWGLSAFFVFYQFFLQASTSVMYPELIRDFHINVTQVGLLSSAFYVVYLILQMPAGMFVDRCGARLALVLGALSLSLSCMSFGLTTLFSIALLSRMTMGIVASPGIVSAFYLARNWFPVRSFALLVGLTEMIGMMGAAIGEPLLSRAVTAAGRKDSLLACAVVGFLLSVSLFFVVRNKPAAQPVTHLFQETTEKSLPKESVFSAMRAILGNPQIWLLGLYSGFMFTGVAAFAALWGVPYVTQVYGLSSERATLIVSLVFWGAALGAPTVGWLAGRISAKKKLLYVGSGASFILLMTLLGFSDYFSEIFLAGALFSLGFISSVYILPFSLVRDHITEGRHAAAMGFTNMMSVIIGTAILQPLIGFLLDLSMPIFFEKGVPVYDSAAYFFALSPIAICLAMAFVMVYWITEKCAVKSPYESYSAESV